MQKGETVRLLVYIKNVGDGASVKAQAYLKNTDNLKHVFIEKGKGRAEFENLAAGGEKTAEFEFSIKPELEETEFTMEIGAGDSDARMFTSEQVKLKIQPALTMTPAPADSVLNVSKGVDLHSSPVDDSPQMGKTTADGAAKVRATAPGWAKIELEGGRYAWIKAAPGLNPAPGKPTLTAAVTAFHKAPTIDVAADSYQLYTESDKVTLKVSAKDDEIVKDMFIYDNRTKVFYKSNKDGPDKAGMAVEAPFDLEEGENIIRIMARESEKYSGGKTIVINRKKTPKPPAEAPSVPVPDAGVQNGR